jgi:AcrR family transcriptional regulator
MGWGKRFCGEEVMEKVATPVGQRNIGRPSREKALQRQEELLDRALDLFLEHGYAHTTMDAIASSLTMTKRTIYARYEDKAAFFRAVVQRAIERMVASQASTLATIDTDSLEGTLEAIARMRIHQVMTPEGMRLQRIVNAESNRFPEIFRMARKHVTQPVVEFLSGVLRKHAAEGSIRVERPEMTATAFMSMVVGAPIRVLASGNRVDETEMEDRISFCITLLKHGIAAP